MAISEQDYSFYHKGQTIEVGNKLFLARNQNPILQIFEGDEVAFNPETILSTPIYRDVRAIPKNPCGYLISPAEASRLASLR